MAEMEDTTNPSRPRLRAVDAWEEPPPGWVDPDAPKPARDPNEGKVPPHDLDAEGAVLSCVMVDPEALPKIADLLKPEHFYSESHRRIFEACVAVRDAGQPVDVVQVATWLRAANRIAQVGGLAYLTEVLNCAPAVANVGAYARTVHAKWRLREIIRAAQRIAAEGYLPLPDPDAFIESAERSIANVGHAGARYARQIVSASVEEIFAPLPPITWQCHGLRLAAGAPVMLAGYGYGGKTITAQAIGLAVATGEPALGLFGVKRGRVKHFDYEQGRHLTFERYQRLARAMRLEEAELAASLSVSIMPQIYLDTPGAESVFARSLEGYSLAIVDSFKASTPATDENASTARAPLDMLTRISDRTGCCIVIIHHARKPSEKDDAGSGGARMTARGSSAIYDALNSLFVVVGKKGEPTKVLHEKERLTGSPLEDFYFRVEDVPDPRNPHDARWGVRVVHMDAEQVPHKKRARRAYDECVARVLECVKSTPNVSLRRLRVLVGGKKDYVDEALSELLEAKQIVALDGTNGGRAYRHVSGV